MSRHDCEEVVTFFYNFLHSGNQKKANILSIPCFAVFLIFPKILTMEKNVLLRHSYNAKPSATDDDAFNGSRILY